MSDKAGGVLEWKDQIIAGFVSVLFLGYSPVASGTVASIPGIFVALLLGDSPRLTLVVAVVLFALGVVASTRAEKIFGRKDPSQVTIDEFVGMLIALWGLPVTWGPVVAVFLFYRLFDIFKPFPARQCERIKGGLGIMADDVVAGIYANLLFRLIDYLL
ncbi:MAG: phosphatidylglycerophosphatase A [Candidatus Lindowbacteria bacterium]|nr:phosphatidylglycerophosphatase A [Candidatus Lindowbacteria bacterium]